MKVPSAHISGDRSPALIAGMALCGAMVLGGGGSPAPGPELAVQMLVAALAIAWLVLVPSEAGRPGRAAVLIGGVILLLPLAQLVPLPPAVWQALPGRDSQRAALALIGAENTWRPLSLAPARTVAAVVALIPAVLVMLMVASLRRAGRNMVVGTMAGVGLLSLLIGFAQLPRGVDNPFRFYVPDVGYLNGFQANHNSAADVLLIAMIAAAAVIREWHVRQRPRALRFGPFALIAPVAAAFSLGVFLTGSRAGTFLLPVAWAWIAAIVWPWRQVPVRQGWFKPGWFRPGWLKLGGIALAACAGAGLVLHGEIATRILSRYSFAGEFRPQLWIDALFAARIHFPWGAGLGAFVPVFLAAERLEAVDATMPNRAHNDFLELAIEAGLPGLAVLAAISAILAKSAWAAWRGRSVVPTVHASFSLGTLSVIAMHSLVDYPLRSMSLACMAAAAAGVLLPPGSPQAAGAGELEGRT